MPFDRLIRLVDDWAEQNGRTDVFAQIGAGAYVPRHFPSVAYLAPGEFQRHIREAEAVISHAGTGNILAALENRKRILVFPRSTALREATTDHQVATARFFQSKGYVHAVYEEAALPRGIAALLDAPEPPPCPKTASGELLARIRQFIFEEQ